MSQIVISCFFFYMATFNVPLWRAWRIDKSCKSHMATFIIQSIAFLWRNFKHSWGKKNQCSSWILAIFVFAKWYNSFFFGCEYRLSLISLLRCPAKAIPSMKLKYKKWKNLQKLTYMQVWWSLFHQSLRNCIKSISVL